MSKDPKEKITRCRRLGHEVPFSYCLTETEGKPCRLILDCWWQQFDVRSYLAKHLPPEQLRKLEEEKAPPDKIASLLEIIERAKSRIEQDESED